MKIIKPLFILLCIFLCAETSYASDPVFIRKTEKSDLLLRLMEKDIFFRPYIAQAKEYNIQIIYTQIHRDDKKNPSFTQYNYRLNSREYFNPASLVKWPLILLGMEKINKLKKSVPGISLNSKMEFLGNSVCSPHITVDKLAQDQTPRLANYIKEMLLVSDDDAYNRMYDFLGQEYINTRLTEMGYDSLRIMVRFAPCSQEQNRKSPEIRFLDDKGKTIYRQAETTSSKHYSNPLGKVLIGKAHMNNNGVIVNTPKDYSFSNNMSLQDINDLMLYVFFKDVVPSKKKFNLTDSDYNLLYKYTAMYPYESEFPAFKQNKKKYPVHLKKYLYYGKNSATPNTPGLKIHNMVGESHGTLSDVAYFVNPETGVEFMLSVVINTCYDGIIASPHYHYWDKGQPFLARLGKLIYEYEVKKGMPVK